MNTKQLNRIFARAMYGMVIAAMVLSLSGTAFAEDEPPSPTPWRDEFEGSLTEEWDWYNENPDKWNLIENPGFLRIYASPYGIGAENLLLRSVAPGDFTIKTHLLFEPDTNFQFAALIIWQDEYNFLQFGRAFCDVEDSCVGNGLYFDKAEDGNVVGGNFATSIDNTSDVFLRLERRGNMVRAFYSIDDGISWYEIGTHWIPDGFQVNGVGLTASADFYTPDWDIPADFDFFELTEGWGFLPEGFHDYDEGDVPYWACNAGGWAVDPDDREGDVNIEVVVDDQTVVNLVAGEFRQDLFDAEVCVDGNCSFFTSLWDKITSYEPHRVDVWAQDGTGEWVLISNSAKTLTCWGYPEGFHDGVEGETDDVNSCGAFGWASDPDNRDRDLGVQILADGEIVAITSANQIRDDVDVCPDRACGFSVSLWGLVSQGDEHQIKAQAYDEETDAWYDLETTEKSLTCNVPPSPTPWFTVFPEQGVVEGWDWPLGAKLQLRINGDVYSTTESSIITPWDPESNATWAWIDFSEAYTVQPGDVVAVSLLGSGMMEQTHTVQNLSVSKVDQMDDTVKGFADPGAEVHVWPYAGQEQLAIAKEKGDAAGKWNADFSGDFDLTPGECGRSEIYDEAGNRTAVDWCIPNTRFTVWPEWNYLEGYEWPVRDEVSISVAGKEETCSLEITPDFPEWDLWNTFFSVNFSEDCTLEAGDLITLSSETFNFTHQIQDLAITDVNLEYNTVTGTAVFDPEQYIIHTWVHDADGSYMQMSADGGTWIADFGSLGFDLQPGMGGRVELVDQVSNATAVDWHVPLPSFAAYMSSAIEGYDWPMGHEITLTINGDEYIAYATSEQRPDFPDGETRVLFELWRDEFSMETGDRILMTDETLNFTKELYVADLQVTAFNLIDRTVSGVHDPDRSFWTQLEGQDPLDINFEANTWAATFADMTPGTWGYVAQDDWDHDGTVWDFQVPDTYVAVANHEDWIDSVIAVSAGQSFTIKAFGLMNPCSDTYPNGSEICIFYTPVGGEWSVPDENQYGIFPGSGLPFMALLGRIGEGEPFYVGEGGTFTAEQNGTLWFTPNDNLRTDNQGAYSVLVWLE